jgi:hypothetical protein
MKLQRVLTCSYALLILLVATSACMTEDFGGNNNRPTKTPPPSTQQPPIYPGARQITNEPTPVADYAKFVFLESSDKPQDIQAFYNKVLFADGWSPITVPLPATPDSIYFRWEDYSEHSERYEYTLDVVIKPEGTGKTRIELKLLFSPAM